MTEEYCFTVNVGAKNREEMVFQGDDEERAKNVYDFYRRHGRRVILIAEELNPYEHFSRYSYEVLVGPPGQARSLFEDRSERNAEQVCLEYVEQGLHAEVVAIELDDYPFDLMEDDEEDEDE